MKSYPKKAGELSEVVKTIDGYGVYMLIEEDPSSEYQEAIRWLNTMFAPDFRIIYKPTGSAMPYGMLGSIGWKIRKPDQELTASEVLNGEYRG